jgi:hypothetical protein
VEKFSGVVLLFDNDGAGVQASAKAKSILDKRGIKSVEARCIGSKDANEMLVNGNQIVLSQIIRDAFDRLDSASGSRGDGLEKYYIASSDRFVLFTENGHRIEYNSKAFRTYVSNVLMCDAEPSDVTRYIAELMDFSKDNYCVRLVDVPYKSKHRRFFDGSSFVLNENTHRTIDENAGDPAKLLQFFYEMFGDEQLKYFLSWLSYFYIGCKEYNLQPSSALYLTGDQGAGKSLFHDAILPAIIGEGVDGVSLFTTSFSGLMFKYPFVKFPDSFAELSDRERNKFTDMVKNMVANGDRVVNNKYGSMNRIEWAGRIIVSMNLGNRSSDALPNFEEKDKDKFMLLRVTKGDMVSRLTRKEWEQIIRDEAPKLAWYLGSYQIPDELRDQRFGVKTYHHKDLEEIINDADPMKPLVDLIQEYINSGARLCALEMSASEIFTELVNFESPKNPRLRAINENQKVSNFGKKLSDLADKKSWITKVKKSKGTYYRIEREHTDR